MNLYTFPPSLKIGFVKWNHKTTAMFRYILEEEPHETILFKLFNDSQGNWFGSPNSNLIWKIFVSQVFNMPPLYLTPIILNTKYCHHLNQISPLQFRCYTLGSQKSSSITNLILQTLRWNPSVQHTHLRGPVSSSTRRLSLFGAIN